MELQDEFRLMPGRGGGGGVEKKNNPKHTTNVFFLPFSLLSLSLSLFTILLSLNFISF